MKYVLTGSILLIAVLSLIDFTWMRIRWYHLHRLDRCRDLIRRIETYKLSDTEREFIEQQPASCMTKDLIVFYTKTREVSLNRLLREKRR